MATAPARQPMTNEEIAAILTENERASINFRDTLLADEQANAIDFYEAKPFGDEEEGRSQVVSPDVAEVVDYMQISVLRTAVSGDRVVEFEPGDTDQIPELPDPPQRPNLPPQQPDAPPDPQAQQAMAEYQQAKAAYDKEVAPVREWEDKRTQAAEDATEAVNYIFMRRQNGYRILLDWLQSGLIEKIGIIKTACVTETKKVKQSMTMPEEGLAMLAQEGIEPIAATDNGDGTWTVTVEQEQEVKRYLDFPVPSEEYLFAPRTRDEDGAIYQAHRARKTLSDLIEMGFDRETVEALPTDDGDNYMDQRTESRWDDETVSAFRRTPSMREVWLLEEYVRLDVDDDGIAELVKVFRVKDTILEITEVDEPPFVVWTPFPRAHRMVGNSLAEKVMDIQRVNTVLLRQALDGVYQTNSPRMSVNTDSLTEDTIDDLLTVRPGAIVRYRGAAKPEPLYEPFDIQKSLGMLEYMSGLRETRTGITRLNQGLDEDTINKTASGQAALQATGQQIEEFVARNFAEAMARLFAKKLRLMAEHGEPIAIKVDGNYRRVDPTTWDREMNVAVRVGLGSGRKEQRLVYRQQLLEIQEQAIQYGLADPKRLFNNASAMIRDSGLGNPNDYLIDPDSDDFAEAQANRPQQQDPAVIKAQADAQAQQAKLQMEGQAKQADATLREQEAAERLTLAREEAAAKIEIARENNAATIQLMREKAQEEAALARDKAQFEMAMAEQQADREWQLAQQQAERDAEIARKKAEATSMPKNRPGGDLSK